DGRQLARRQVLPAQEVQRDRQPRGGQREQRERRLEAHQARLATERPSELNRQDAKAPRELEPMGRTSVRPWRLGALGGSKKAIARPTPLVRQAPMSPRSRR